MDALGNLARFVLLPGQRHDTIGVPPLIEGVAFGALLGDRALDVDWLRAELDVRGAVAVIPPRAGRKTLTACDRAMYRWRPLTENCFAKLKEFHRVLCPDLVRHGRSGWLRDPEDYALCRNTAWTWWR